ncbi:MAG: hypothetical protein NTZ05_08585, partial [Chloroflexi bacterium]|nr:hypothetical protein [Chloroflexota bacterium]
LAGLLWGLAGLAKGTNAALPLLLLAPLLIGWGRDWRRWAPGYAALGAMLLVTMLPWTARNALLFGRPVFVSTNVGIQGYISTLDPITFDVTDPRLKVVLDEAQARKLNEADTDRLFMTRAIERVLANPGGYLGRAADNLLRLYQLPPRDAVEYLKPTVLYNDLPEYQRIVRLHKFLLWTAVAGLAVAAYRRQRVLLSMWIVPLGTALTYAPFWVIPRFIAPALPVLFIAAVGGLWLAVSSLSASPKVGRSLRWASAGAMALWIAASAAVFWGAHRPGWVVESAHPYPDGADLVWAIVNPDDEAASTRLHFGRVQMAGPGDRLIVLDGEFKVLDELQPEKYAAGGWTAAYPGRLVVVKLLTDGQGADWGFSVDAAAGGTQ